MHFVENQLFKTMKLQQNLPLLSFEDKIIALIKTIQQFLSNLSNPLIT